MYAKIENNVAVKWPYTKDDLRKENSQTSFPSVISDELLLEYGVVDVFITDQPQVNYSKIITQEPPVFNIDNARWETSWVVRDKTTDEIASTIQSLQSSIVQATQQHLDEFANARNYDGILSACTYVTSSIPKFQNEGQYCVEARDTTWATLYQILVDVSTGVRPMPAGYADIASELPVLLWPILPE